MRFFITHVHHFTTFRRCLITLVYMETRVMCLKAYVLEALLEIKYNSDRGYYNRSTSSKLSAIMVPSSSTHFISCMSSKPKKLFFYFVMLFCAYTTTAQ